MYKTLLAQIVTPNVKLAQIQLLVLHVPGLSLDLVVSVLLILTKPLQIVMFVKLRTAWTVLEMLYYVAVVQLLNPNNVLLSVKLVPFMLITVLVVKLEE